MKNDGKKFTPTLNRITLLFILSMYFRKINEIYGKK